ncbi:tRNA (adenine(58)-N(1))-methyltransferase, mitochondrial isoform X2 [Colius striatus]|uniref:tRNA (adenine(58)-N(1))-methyltransferase, mitochondrial isoform X2 n=1 Tax=Colius striatus TaxID=57412 RepID=UPI002B1E4151|nr:tRNA (adenine(58)-N(1))-methyltransferase, mitochondrial isoform X2 [Colius striatus]
MRAWRALRRAASSDLSSGHGPAPGGRPRRRAWEASLSPLERVRRLLPPEEAEAVGRCAAASRSPSEREKEMGMEMEAEEVAADLQAPLEATGARPGPFRAGELALAEMRRKHNATLKQMCWLAAGSALTTPGGVLPHRDIIGQLPGQVLRASAGARLLLRRPSLEEYVLLMPRGPTIAYPKDINAILMMTDVHPGDTVLETGSGSGAMSLFLSRAVGPRGRVISYEVREDHHNLAKKNYKNWRAAWEIGHTEEWPDNVDFILKDISAAAVDMKSVTLDAVILDMLDPQSALPVVRQSLKQGGVCAVYLANITQVVDLLDRIRTCKLPFVCERILEVTHRKWMVLPAKPKNCKTSEMVENQENIEEPPQKQYEEIHIQDQVVLKENEYNESLSDSAEPYWSVPYVARPACWQEAHSATVHPKEVLN